MVKLVLVSLGLLLIRAHHPADEEVGEVLVPAGAAPGAVLDDTGANVKLDHQLAADGRVRLRYNLSAIVAGLDRAARSITLRLRVLLDAGTAVVPVVLAPRPPPTHPVVRVDHTRGVLLGAAEMPLV